MQFWVPMEKHQLWSRGWINLPIAWKFHFLEEIIFYKVYYLNQKPYCVSYFFFISRLQKYYTNIFIHEKHLCEYLTLFFRSFSFWSKVIIKAVSNIIGIGYSITIIKGGYSSVTDPNCSGDQYTNLGAQTLTPKKQFSSFLFSVVFRQKIHWISDQWFPSSSGHFKTA